IELDEHESVVVRLDADSARALQVAAAGGLTVTPAAEPGTFQVVAAHYVGAVGAGSVEVRIRPKVPVDNVLYLLTAWWDRRWWRSEAASYAPSEVSAAFVALFADAVTQLLRRGVRPDYVEVVDDLDTIRGRVDLTGQFRRPGLLVPVTCRFSELTVDTPANRYLKHAVLMALRVPGAWRATRRQLRHALAALDGVADDPPRADLPRRMHFTRLDRPYEPVLQLAHVVRSGAGITDVAGDISAAAFLLDMNQVFERFVEDRLRALLAGDLLVDGQVADHIDEQGSVPIRPDLVLRDVGGTIVYVGDAKYKLSRDGLGRAADYYQLHAYCTRFGLDEGVLIYGTEEGGAPPPRSITTRGDAVRLRTLRLPLMGTPTDLDAAVAAIADDIRQSAGRRKHVSATLA
ncbi:MAG TPA: hypothetical protein VHF25_14350, partial [Nitriliruptorales bacterium]|nr:hypothetical protein [Nitriliruptorales bacterium]